MLSHVNCVWLFVTQWTVAHRAPLSVGFSRQEYWSGLPCPPPGDLPDSGIELVSLMSPSLAGGFFTTSDTWVWEVFWGQSCLLRTWLQMGSDATWRLGWWGDAGEGGAAGGPAQASCRLVPFGGPFQALRCLAFYSRLRNEAGLPPQIIPWEGLSFLLGLGASLGALNCWVLIRSPWFEQYSTVWGKHACRPQSQLVLEAGGGHPREAESRRWKVGPFIQQPWVWPPRGVRCQDRWAL